MRTVFFVGAGRHQRGAIEQARARGLRVATVDRDPEAPGLASADVAAVVDFADVDAVVELARRTGIDGVLTVASDRAVTVVANVAEELGLPGIGRKCAHRATHKLAMREALRASGAAQPAFAGLRAPEDIERALELVGLPAVVKPVDSGGQRAVFRVETREALDGVLDEVIGESQAGEAILEEFVDGLELNAVVVVRDGSTTLVALSDRLRPPGVGFAVGWAHVHPATLSGEQLRLARRVAEESVTALGLRDAVAFPQLIARPDGRISLVEVAARVPGGEMASLVRHAVGVDLVDVALRQALGEHVPDEMALPRFSRPLAIRFLTAAPGQLPTGRVTRVGGLELVLAAEGVVQAGTYLQVGETIRPVRRDGDRRGYVIATADTPGEALRRADAAAGRLTVEVEVEAAA